MKDIVIYGAGGFAREVAWLMENAQGFGEGCVKAFVDDYDFQDRIVNGIPVLSFEQVLEQYPNAEFALGVGDPKARKILDEKVTQAGFKALNAISDNVRMSRFVEYGDGTVICDGNTLTTNIKLGRQVQINLACTIGHDVEIGDYSTLTPGVNVSGNVVLGKGVYIGTGASIVNGSVDKKLYIGDGAVIAAGSCVTTDVDPFTLSAGVPAKAKKTYPQYDF